jgi:hypothetical protein
MRWRSDEVLPSGCFMYESSSIYPCRAIGMYLDHPAYKIHVASVTMSEIGVSIGKGTIG